MRADLHIHTTASDGCWSPEQLVAEIQARSIGLFAVADHDTIASLPRCEALARSAGLAFLPGVEISTRCDERLFHVLAYGFDQRHPLLHDMLVENRAKLTTVGDFLIHRLWHEGYGIDLEEYAAYQYDAARGGWKTFNFLVDHGFCADVREYSEKFREHLAATLPAFPHPAEAVTVIRAAGGVPILAHPGASLRSVGVAEKTLHPFLGFGIAGLECYSSYHDVETTRFCLAWCARHDLLVTGGSDCHGGFVGRELGVPVVESDDLRLGELAERAGLAELNRL
ncbi:MAG TPA: PHP domain-containing protein [Chloroflexi bacterium]|nr:PHP domain-containing protein [Chloroflexota bacterium]